MCVCARAKQFIWSCGIRTRWFHLLLLFATMMMAAVVENLIVSIYEDLPSPIYTAMSAVNSESGIRFARMKLRKFLKNINKRWSEENPDLITIMPKTKNFENTAEALNVFSNVTNATTRKRKKKKELCCLWPPYLGPIPVNKTEIELENVEQMYPEVRKGGRYSPPHCTARHRVAIIVPYRNRLKNLAIFLNHMHPFLMKQELDYGIFIIEQSGKAHFNRAKLLNVGFVESQKQRRLGWQCFIFHDVDLLPMDERNMYSCPRHPRHMSAAIDKFQFKLPYKKLFGGVVALTREQFLKVNGFSNKYWGWGGEDDDMYLRLTKSNYSIERYEMSVARYVMLPHEPQTYWPSRKFRYAENFQRDGLNSLKYKLILIVQHHLYTHVVVNFDHGFINKLMRDSQSLSSSVQP